MHKTRYMTKAIEKANHINLDSYPNAGPNPSVLGMKRLFWGEDCYTVRQGQYVYKVPYSVWVCAME